MQEKSNVSQKTKRYNTRNRIRKQRQLSYRKRDERIYTQVLFRIVIEIRETMRFPLLLAEHKELELVASWLIATKRFIECIDSNGAVDLAHKAFTWDPVILCVIVGPTLVDLYALTDTNDISSFIDIGKGVN